MAVAETALASTNGAVQKALDSYGLQSRSNKISAGNINHGKSVSHGHQGDSVELLDSGQFGAGVRTKMESNKESHYGGVRSSGTHAAAHARLLCTL